MSRKQTLDHATACKLSQYENLVKHTKWYTERHPSVSQLPPDWLNWLLHRGSLTERLMAFSEDKFQVNVLSQRWERPLNHEAQSLGIPLHLVARIREVELCCDGVVVVFARSVMPLQVFLEQRHVLANIGSRPLGHLLFKDGKIRISKRNIAISSGLASDVVRGKALNKGDSNEEAKTIYGRSTPYQYINREILVSEYFVNNLLIGNHP